MYSKLMKLQGRPNTLCIQWGGLVMQGKKKEGDQRQNCIDFLEGHKYSWRCILYMKVEWMFWTLGASAESSSLNQLAELVKNRQELEARGNVRWSPRKLFRCNTDVQCLYNITAHIQIFGIVSSGIVYKFTHAQYQRFSTCINSH